MIPDGRALCLRCGRSGPIVWQSMDPGHPFVRCEWGKAPNLHGHGIVLGTIDQAESDAIQVDLRERRLSGSHLRGGHDKRPDHKCPLCVLEQPHRGHLRARYSDPHCDRCQVAAARELGPNPGSPAPADLAGTVAQSRRSA